VAFFYNAGGFETTENCHEFGPDCPPVPGLRGRSADSGAAKTWAANRALRALLDALCKSGSG
jgi:hypothetical protein